MKKLFFLVLCLSIIFISCKQKNESDTSGRINPFLTPDTSKVYNENPKLEEYRNFVLMLDSSDVNTVSLALNEFKLKFDSLNPNLADSAFFILQNYLDTVEMYQNNKLENDTTEYEVLFTGEKVPESVLHFKDSLMECGFRIQLSDDVPYIVLERKYFIEQLKNRLSEPMKQYLFHVDIEFLTGFSDVDKIIIKPAEFIDRIIWYEKFMTENPDFVFLAQCEKYYKAYLTYLISGFETTQVFKDKNNLTLTEFYNKAYTYLFKKYNDSNTTLEIKPLYDAILQKNRINYNEIRKQLIIKGKIFDLNS